MNLSQRREDDTRQQGLSDLLLPFALIEDGVLLQQDGSLLAAWRYRGPDMDSATDDEMNALHKQLNEIIRLGSGWMINADLIRSEATGYPTSQFPDDVSALIDAERMYLYKQHGEHFQSERFLTLTYLPPLNVETRVKMWILGDGENYGDIGRHHLDFFNRRIRHFETIFGNLFHATRLRREGTFDTLLEYLHTAITGKHHKIVAPKNPSYLSQQVLSSEDFRPGLRPMIGAKTIAIVAVDGYPSAEESFPGMFHELDQLAIPYRWSTRAKLMDALYARGVLEKIRMMWRGNKRGFKDDVMRNPNGDIDEFAAEMEEDARIAKAAANNGYVQYCSYSSNVILMCDEPAELARRVDLVRRTIETAGFPSRLEDVNATKAWFGAIPGDGYSNRRRSIIHTANLAGMLPITSVWEGSEKCPDPKVGSAPLIVAATDGATPFNFNLHVGDLGHTIIAGPSGAGKSTLDGLIGAQWLRYPNAQVFVIDKRYSAWLLTQAVGGRFFDLGASGLQLAPFADLETPADAVWAADYLETLCQLSRLDVTPPRRNAISAAVEQMMRRPGERTLSHLHGNVADEDVRAALRPYTVLEPLGMLLDAEKDALSIGGSRFVTFEMDKLLGLREQAVIPVLLYLFRKIEQRLDGSPTLIILDECWSYLAHELFAKKIEELLRTARKSNATVVMSSQQLSDWANNKFSDVFFDNVATTILLPNAKAKSPLVRQFYDSIGLNDRQLDLIANGIPKRDYYMVNAYGERLFDLQVGPVGLAFCGVNSPVERALAKTMMAQRGSDWPAAWLDSRGLPDWAEYLRQQKEDVAV